MDEIPDDKELISSIRYVADDISVNPSSGLDIGITQDNVYESGTTPGSKWNWKQLRKIDELPDDKEIAVVDRSVADDISANSASVPDLDVIQDNVYESGTTPGSKWTRRKFEEISLLA
jgi:hypothetical protein